MLTLALTSSLTNPICNSNPIPIPKPDPNPNPKCSRKRCKNN